MKQTSLILDEMRYIEAYAQLNTEHIFFQSFLKYFLKKKLLIFFELFVNIFLY